VFQTISDNISLDRDDEGFADAKIPLILLATWAMYVTYTPPNPPPPQQERFPPSMSVPLELGVVKWVPTIGRVPQFVLCAAEISTILASANPSSSLSKLILSLIVWNTGKTENLHISYTAAIGLTIMVLAGCIRLMCYRHLGRFFRFETSIQKDHELIVSGPYSVVRHPSYTAFVLLSIGWFPWQMSEGSWIMESGLWNTMLGRLLVVIYAIVLIFFSISLLARMSKEDESLRNHFGNKWDDWAKRVPYSVFPGIL